MSSPKPPYKSQTLLGQVTQAVKTIQAKVNVQALALKPNARVPELWVQEAGSDKAQVYPLLGDRYLVGRSSKSCDIVVRNPVVSQIHLSVSRNSTQRRSPFILKDENSTNGVYRGKRRVTTLELRHGDILTLGPPELAASVRLQYFDPPLCTFAPLTGLLTVLEVLPPCWHWELASSGQNSQWFPYLRQLRDP